MRDEMRDDEMVILEMILEINIFDER